MAESFCMVFGEYNKDLKIFEDILLFKLTLRTIAVNKRLQRMENKVIITLQYLSEQ